MAKDSTILFVDIRFVGTLGNALLNGAKEVKLFGETIEVQAKIENLPGISGHADVNQLTKWVSMFDPKPKRVFIVHGEDKVALCLAAHIHEELGLEAYAPFSGDAFDLLTGACKAGLQRGGGEKEYPRSQQYFCKTCGSRRAADDGDPQVRRYAEPRAEICGSDQSTLQQVGAVGVTGRDRCGWILRRIFQDG